MNSAFKTCNQATISNKYVKNTIGLHNGISPIKSTYICYYYPPGLFFLITFPTALPIGYKHNKAISMDNNKR